MKKGFFRIGTATTPRKQKAIRKALEGTLDGESYQHAQDRWRRSIFQPLRDRMNPGWWTDADVWDFADECITDAFQRIKEYDPKYKFRSFLAEIIIIPKLDKLYKAKNSEQEEKEAYSECMRKEKPLNPKNLADEIKPNMEKELAREVLRKLKAEDETKYEVFCYKEFNGWEYKDIAKECKVTEANARQIYKRVKEDLIPKLFSELSQRNKYLDKDLKIRQNIINLIKKEIKGK